MGTGEGRTVARREIMTITTILCDLDGTLVDSRLDIAVAFQHAWRTVVGGTPAQCHSDCPAHRQTPRRDALRARGRIVPPAGSAPS